MKLPMGVFDELPVLSAAPKLASGVFFRGPLRALVGDKAEAKRLRWASARSAWEDGRSGLERGELQENDKILGALNNLGRLSAQLYVTMFFVYS